MIQTNIILEGDGSMNEIAGLLDVGEGLYAITALEGGMSSGKPSVAFISKMKNGRYLFAETSMNIFLAAAKTFETKFGPPSDAVIPSTIDPEAGTGKLKSNPSALGSPCKQFEDGESCKLDKSYGFCCDNPCRLSAQRV